MAASERVAPACQEPRPLPIVAEPPQGSPSRDVDRPLLDQVHDRAQVAADNLQSFDAAAFARRAASRALPTSATSPPAPFSRSTAVHPARSGLRPRGDEGQASFAVAQTVSLAVAAVQVRRGADRREDGQDQRVAETPARRRRHRRRPRASPQTVIPARPSGSGSPSSRPGTTARSHPGNRSPPARWRPRRRRRR